MTTKEQFLLEAFRTAIWDVFSAKDLVANDYGLDPMFEYDDFWAKFDAQLKVDIPRSVRAECQWGEGAALEICHENDILPYYDAPTSWQRVQDLVHAAIKADGRDIDFALEPYNRVVTSVFVYCDSPDRTDDFDTFENAGEVAGCCTDEELDAMFEAASAWIR